MADNTARNLDYDEYSEEEGPDATMELLEKEYQVDTKDIKNSEGLTYVILDLTVNHQYERAIKELKAYQEYKAGFPTYKMNIVEFADFSCPHCKTAAPVLHAFAKSRKDVNLTFMNFPLDGNCNPAIQGPGKTCTYAKATLCANSLGKGWETHDWFFKNQGNFDGLDLVVKDLGIDAIKLKECVESTATHEAVMKQATQGKDAGVKGTPAVFVNGRLLMGGQFMPILNEAYKTLN